MSVWELLGFSEGGVNRVRVVLILSVSVVRGNGVSVGDILGVSE